MRKKDSPIIKENPWVAFQYPFFKILWITSVVSSIGTWMQDIAVAWFMTSLTTSPLLVSLVQAVTSFSIFLLALPAGALADIIDRRMYLIFLQIFMMIVAGLLALLTFLGKVSPNLLLFLTFLLGAGGALNMPTWLAAMSEIVPTQALSSAATLTSVGINIARAVGPALAGVVIAIAGPATVFALNALSFFGIILTLLTWQQVSRKEVLPAERLLGAIRVGVHYVVSSPILLTLFIKSFAFFCFCKWHLGINAFNCACRITIWSYWLWNFTSITG